MKKITTALLSLAISAPVWSYGIEVEPEVKVLDEYCMRNQVGGVQLGDNISTVKTTFPTIVEDKVGARVPGFGRLVGEEGNRRWYVQYNPAGTIFNVSYETLIPFQEIAAVKQQLCDRYALREDHCGVEANIPQAYNDHIWGAENGIAGKVRACIITTKLTPLKVRTYEQTITGTKTIRSLNTDEVRLYIKAGKSLQRALGAWEEKNPKVAQQRPASKEYF